MYRKKYYFKIISIAFIFLLILSACSSIEKAEALHRQGEKEDALDMAISLLDDDNEKVRMRAVKLVGRIGGEEAGPALHRRLAETDQRVLREVVRNLGMINYEPSIEDIADMVPDASEDMLRAIAIAFNGFGKNGIDELVSRYDSPSQKIYRASYRELLIKIGPEISDSISKLLKGRSYFENRDTFEILRRIKNPRVATLMLPYLSDEEVADQVIEAMKHLGKNAVEATILALKKQKKDQDLLVTERLIKILGLLKAKAGIEMLESFSQNESDRIRNAVEHSLYQIRGF